MTQRAIKENVQFDVSRLWDALFVIVEEEEN